MYETERSLDRSKVIVIDTETTGVKPENDEILSLSIVDGNGKTLFNDLIKPAHKRKWNAATEINGITYNDVKDKKMLDELRDVLIPIFDAADLVVGYNVMFDIRMLRSNGLNMKHVATFDVMREFANLYNKGRFAKLAACAEFFGYKFSPHDSLEDVKATLHCFNALTSEEEEKNRNADAKEKKATIAKSTLIFVVLVVAACLCGLFAISCLAAGSMPMFIVFIGAMAVCIAFAKTNYDKAERTRRR